MFVNVPGAKQIAVVTATENRVRSFPMEKFQANFPMALDEANHRLFVGCRRPARLVILSSEDGKEIGNTEISEDTDDLFYDAKRKRVYVSCGEGFIDVIDCGAPETPRRIEKVATRPGARTSLFSAELDRLFLAVPRHGGEQAELRIYDVKE